MSDDQEIHVEDLTTVSKFFSQIPSVIHHMGLGCYIVAYYCLLKAVAEEKKTCFMSQSTISSLLGCSIKQIQLMTNFMEKPFAALGGKSLIKVTRRKNEKKEKETNVIQIVDIWVENITAMKDRKSIPKTPMKEKKIKDKEKFSTEPGSLPTEPGSLGTVPGTDKEEPFKKNPSKNIPISSSSEEKQVAPADDAGGADDDPDKNIGENIWFRKTNGQMKKITLSEIYLRFIKLPFSTETVTEAISRFKILTSPINNALKYLESICVTIDKEKENKPFKAKETAVKDQPQESIKTSEPTMTVGEYLKCRNKKLPSPSGKA